MESRRVFFVAHISLHRGEQDMLGLQSAVQFAFGAFEAWRKIYGWSTNHPPNVSPPEIRV